MIWEWDDLNCIWSAYVEDCSFARRFSVRIDWDGATSGSGCYGRVYTDNGATPVFRTSGDLESVKADCEEYYWLQTLIASAI